MRVAILARDYPPRRGGLSTYAYGLVQHLEGLGVEVETLVGHSDLRTLAVPLLKNLSGYDIVHVMSPPYAAFVRHPGMVVAIAEPAATEWPYYTLGLKLKAGPAYVLERYVFGRGGCFVALSETARLKLVGKFSMDPSSIRVIPAGVDTSLFAPAGKAMNPARVLLLSRLDRRKNISEAIMALAELKGESLECVVVGSGPEMGSLQMLARSLRVAVRFTGGVSEEEVRGYYATSPIFVTSSYSEGFGLSLVQAMSAGCAVVASDIGAHRELVRDHVDGLIYGGVHDLAEKLKRLLHDPALTRSLGAQARQSAESYSWRRVAPQVKKLYEELRGSR